MGATLCKNLRFHQNMFAFVFKQIMLIICCSVGFFIISAFPPFLPLLGKNVISLKVC